ncbi:metalloregulator ArsR/SmtB family transcription factor [Paenibacillus macerans]|uniref:Bacterial regulatory, arsR family protein n=1 Tax=Paenibacillus macerans TaxID=44252 RepID=A0A090Y6A9_PAEMA|nr:bacterial regulatory, arsR family protein [Paenibacillus macerans]MBS5910969.1 winged helix-turn-helix transcriptional regulator [Paenibacillus macerans]MUG21319.1 metalloregulator ArsR/SmtB family transcription factor [Paenibacillus macerans]SUD25632.1 ArsR family transcriptional regulator [Paenibacillus macerans]GBK62529.1 transcriptional regulator [Paenibacillus macerans]
MESAAAKHDVFQAIADPTRREMLRLLGDRELPLKDISGRFPMSRTAVSKHLRVLAEAGLVHERKVGRETRYRLDADPLLELKRWLDYYERFWENKLSMLKHYVESEPGQSAEGLKLAETSEFKPGQAEGKNPGTGQGQAEGLKRRCAGKANKRGRTPK